MAEERLAVAVMVRAGVEVLAAVVMVMVLGEAVTVMVVVVAARTHLNAANDDRRHQQGVRDTHQSQPSFLQGSAAGSHMLCPIVQRYMQA